MTYALLADEENETKKVIPTILQHVLQEFQDVIHDEISPSLPSMQEIQHCIDFILGAFIPRKFSYRMSLKEHE